MLRIDEIVRFQMRGHNEGTFGILDIREEKVWGVYIPIHSAEERHETWKKRTFGGNVTIDEATEEIVRNILNDFKFGDAVGYIHVGKNPNHKKLADLLFKITNKDFLYELVFDKDKNEITNASKVYNKYQTDSLDFKID